MNRLPGESKSKIGAASRRRKKKRNERTLKRGTLLFIDGENDREMYIIREGKVRILKQEAGITIELAVLGPGSVLGELSLLNGEPRSATAQVVEETTVAVIDRPMLDSTLAALPSWLGTVIARIFSRLTNTLQKTNEAIVQGSVAGVLRLILLLIDSEGKRASGETRISFPRIKSVALETMGLSDTDLENVFMHLIVKGMINIRRTDSGSEYVIVRDREVCSMYMKYLRAQQRGQAHPGANLKEEDIDVAASVLSVGATDGTRVKDKVFRISRGQLDEYRQRSSKAGSIDAAVFQRLGQSRALIVQEPGEKETQQQIIYNEEALRRIVGYHQWVPLFEEEIQF
jgi:CRP-like cAMP-binding protein